MSANEGSPWETNHLIRRIADALGIPEAQLLEADVPPFQGELLDLIRSYMTIADAQGRQRVLNVARREAERNPSLKGEKP